MRWDVSTSLLDAHVGDAHLHMSQRVGEMNPCTLVAGICLGNERNCGLQTETNGVGIAIVPTATNAGITTDFMIILHFQMTIDKLLALSQVGNGVFTQEMSCINEQAAVIGEVETIESATFGSRDFSPDAIVISGGIVSQREIFADPSLRTSRPTQASIERRMGVQIRLDEHVAILLTAARATDVRL